MEDSQQSKVIDYTCSQCGGYLFFQPGTTSLKCVYCGNEYNIELTLSQQIEEKKFEEFANAIDDKDVTFWTTVRCRSCGSIVKLDNAIVGDTCSFCGVPLVVEQTSLLRVIKPQGLIPFQISSKKAYDLFQQWRRKLWFTPSQFKKWLLMPEKFVGVYLPYWTFDAMTTTTYVGQRGDYYYVTVTYTENGKNQHRTERHIRWSPRQGIIRHAFDDVLIVASNNLPTKYLYKLEPWDLTLLVPFDERFLLGFKTEMYQISLNKAFDEAKHRMEFVITDLIRREIGGDEQMITSKETTYQNITFKHILLPVYLSSFRFRNKIFRFVINGQTGEVQGERPYSFWKVLLFGLVVLIGLAFLIWLIVAYFSTPT